MRDQTCFQDWDTVVLKKPNSSSNSNASTGKSWQSNSKINNKDDNEIEKPKKVSTELKIAIQQARMNKKISQKQLASMMCCQPSLINQYESGKAIPNNAFISKLEQKLGCKLPRIKKNN
jgi:putative transcription factor